MTTSSDEGWIELRRALARAVFSGGSYEAMPEAAIAALEAGYDSSALNELAGMEGHSWSELRVAVDAVRREIEADLAGRGEWFSAAHGNDPAFEGPRAAAVGGRYEDHTATTNARFSEILGRIIDDRQVTEGSATTVGAVWEAFLAFARELVPHRGTPINHEFIQVEAAGESFTLSRIATLEDENGDYEGEAEGFVEFRVPGALTLDEDLAGVSLTGPAGEMHPHGDGEAHAYETLEELDRAVRTRVIGALISSPATIEATSATSG